MKKVVQLLITVAVSISFFFWNGSIKAEQLQGKVFEGEIGVETTPLSGVTVKLYAADSVDIPSDRSAYYIDQTTTDANGWYSLTTSVYPLKYYFIMVSLPSGYNYAGARSVDGTVPRLYQILFTTPLTGKTLTGNRFYLKKAGSWNHSPVARAGGPYFIYLYDPICLDGSGSYDQDGGDHINSYGWSAQGNSMIIESGFGPEYASSVTWDFGISASGLYTVILTAEDTHGATSSDTSYLTVSSSVSFQGRVFMGAPGVETSPVSGVSMRLYGSSTPGSIGTEIASTTTDANGWYNLITDQLTYTNYTIVGTDPAGLHSVGTHSPGGVTVSDNQIRYDTPVYGKDRRGNNFYLQPSNPTEVQAPHGGTLSHQFQLYPNYPNPFNPSTIIRYSLPSRNHVTLKITDVLGKEIATLVDEDVQEGYHEVVFSAGELASGMYFCNIRAGSFTQTKRILLIR
jgi:hypothetical protein